MKQTPKTNEAIKGLDILMDSTQVYQLQQQLGNNFTIRLFRYSTIHSQRYQLPFQQ